jgi:ATP-dependent DNA helicase DinG
VNHHLYFADMALRIRGHGEVFPRPDVVIFDEAHQIEQVATQFLGRTVSSGRLDDLLADVRRECAHARLGGGVTDTIIDAIDKTKAGNASVFEELRSGEGRRRFSSGMLSSETLTDATDALGGLASLLESLEVGETGEALSSCAVRARNFEDDLVAILQDENPDRVTWMETRGAHMSLTSAPIELAATFEEALIASTPAILFTSATLSSGPNVEGSQGEDFAFVRSRLGVPADARAMAVESPFDYSRQALLYLPRLGVSPKSPSFQTRMPQEIGRIVNATQGRAFALFTSYRNLKAAAAHLRGKLSYPLLVQGEGSRSALLERFKLLGNAVLLATASFWEGVDVPGPALSCVIVDKLPFVPPGDPIEEARIAHLQERGENPFITYQLPKAILSLRQGLGRLIRNEEDRGVLALLDERVHTSCYGRKILSSLPPCPSTESIDDVAKFFTHPTMSETPEKPPVSPFQGQA